MMQVNRRTFLKSLASSSVAVIVPTFGDFSYPKPKISLKAWELHHRAIVIDLHADTFLWVKHLGYDISKEHHPPLPFNPCCNHVDIPRMKTGGLDAQGFGIVISPTKVKSGAERTFETLDVIDATLQQNASEIGLALTRADIEALNAQKRIAAFLGIEGAHALEGNLEHLSQFYDRGVRYMGLVHFTPNLLAFPANDDLHQDKGLTDLGIEAVLRMNDLGMMIDVAHLNAPGIQDVLTHSKDPVIDSHTGIKSVHDHWRNLDDEQIRQIADRGGVIGVIYYPYYLTGRFLEPIDVVITHIKRLYDVGGIDCVALGSDFDGFIWTVPIGLKDVSYLPALTQLLLDAHFTEEEILKILGQNVLRVFEHVVG